tara:strand:+ start:108 stop:320 length:213 start_codon:yes stop_codon:yes gene_type:complete
MTEVVDLTARKEAGQAHGKADTAQARIGAHEDMCKANQARIEREMASINLRLWGIAFLIISSAAAQLYRG